MDKLLVFDDSAKKKIGMICFAPAIAFFITLVYYIAILVPAGYSLLQPGALVGVTRQYYDTMLIMIAASALIATYSLIYCIVLIARVRNMSSFEKLLWIVELCIFVPVTVIIFWAAVVRKEPKYVSSYVDIA